MTVAAPTNQVISVNPMNYTSKTEFSKYCKGFTSNISSLSCRLILAKGFKADSGKRIEVRQISSKPYVQKIKRIKRMKEIYSSGLKKGDHGIRNKGNVNEEIDDDSTEEILKWLETLK
jgi:hypothetical protein